MHAFKALGGVVGSMTIGHLGLWPAIGYTAVTTALATTAGQMMFGGGSPVLQLLGAPITKVATDTTNTTLETATDITNTAVNTPDTSPVAASNDGWS
jgi:hypothetical protein